ncbi:MAG TPA: hypothetical protein VKP30_08840 [Polyangiaceae bacterium]|nr:hypothetical protein [Polyangiaceae bacterium]
MTREATLHLDEARQLLTSSLKTRWSELDLERALVIEDAFGRFSLACWGRRAAEPMLRDLLAAIGPYAASLFWAPDNAEFDPLELDSSWDESSPAEDDTGTPPLPLRICVRHRMLPAWQQCRSVPLWPVVGSDSCPIVSFYSFKGGMGRTTALATFAIDRARRGDRVVVIDLDLDAPGLGSILSVESPAPYGVVDYLMEAPIVRQQLDLLDYSSMVHLGKLSTEGSIRMFAAGRLDLHYLGKLARLDFEQPGEGLPQHPLDGLLHQVRDELRPDWILLDSRTGFSETAGILLSGMAHFHVLVGVNSTQSWEGLTYAIRRLGADRLRRGYSQAEILLIHAMVPQLSKEPLADLSQRFAEQAEDIFRDSYYAASDEVSEQDIWYLDDAASESAPHRAQQLSYLPSLAQCATIEDLLLALDSNLGGYAQFSELLARRIAASWNP